MALVSCPECLKEVSDSALRCPSCGKQLKKQSKKNYLTKFLSLCVLFSAFPLLSIAAEQPTPDSEAISLCKSEINGTKRLECYDRLFPQSRQENSTATSGIGKWEISNSTSKVDDSQNVILMLQGNETIRTTFSGMVTPTLFIACREKKTEVFVNWDIYLGLEQTRMLYRIDKQKAVNSSWNISSDTKAVFYSGRDIDFINALKGAEKLYVRITPYNESPVETTFDLAGLSEAVKPLQKACGWK